PKRVRSSISTPGARTEPSNNACVYGDALMPMISGFSIFGLSPYEPRQSLPSPAVLTQAAASNKSAATRPGPFPYGDCNAAASYDKTTANPVPETASRCSSCDALRFS